MADATQDLHDMFAIGEAIATERVMIYLNAAIKETERVLEDCAANKNYAHAVRVEGQRDAWLRMRAFFEGVREP